MSFLPSANGGGQAQASKPAADVPAYSTDPAAANGVWTVGADQSPQFVGYDNKAHAGVTFNAQHPEAGAKYVVENFLSQNHYDPNEAGWATKAAGDLNKLYGTSDLFKGDGARLSYGDEFVDTNMGPNAGKFFWGSNGPAAKRPAMQPQVGDPMAFQPLSGNSTSSTASAQPALNTGNPNGQQVGGQLGDVNVANRQNAINSLLGQS